MSPLSTNDRGPCCGPLHAHICTYLKLLEDRGYKQTTTRPDWLLLTDLDGWLARKDYRLVDLNEAVLERFLNYYMRGRHSRRQAKIATLGRLLAMLRDHGWVAAAKILPRSKAQQLLDAYGYYLRDELGFVKTTVAGYIVAARQFLSAAFGEEPANVARLDAKTVVAFIQHYAQDHGRSSAHYVSRALRSFLRFMQHRGYVTIDLASAVPRVACWSLARLPKHLPPGGAEQVLARCNDSTAIGKRNHAILLILARLGLRRAKWPICVSMIWTGNTAWFGSVHLKVVDVLACP